MIKRDPERKRGHEEINDIMLYKKYKSLEQKADAYEDEVRKKQ